MKTNKRMNENDSQRVREYTELFKGESANIRKELVRNLGVLDMLIDMKAFSFEDFALIKAARAIGFDTSAPAFNLDNIVPPCPNHDCGEIENIRKEKESNMYTCRKCKTRFSATKDSIVSGSKESVETWLNVLLCILNYFSISKTCEVCGINTMTYYYIRNRLFLGMKETLKELKLYGKIQVDNTFPLRSYKGQDIYVTESEEDSEFFNDEFYPREPRKRGGSYSMDEKNENHLCVFFAVDDTGHVMGKYVSVGQPDNSDLYWKLGTDWFLDTVPEKDPFDIFKRKKASSSKAGDKSLLIADKEGAIRVYANRVEIPLDAKVFRREGKQVKLRKGANHIQTVNNVHSKFKTMISRRNFFSSKYLPGFIVLFEFIENTGATTEAIERLFEVLATPGLMTSKESIDSMFILPEEKPFASFFPLELRKYNMNQLYGVYLYELKSKETKRSEVISTNEIVERTNYSIGRIRTLHKKLSEKGYIKEIVKYFELEKTGSENTKFSPDILEMYDAWNNISTTTRLGEYPFSKFLKEQNEMRGTHFSAGAIHYKFKEIEKNGIRPPLKNYIGAKTKNVKEYSSEVYNMYDEWSDLRSRTFSGEVPFAKFVANHNEKYNTEYKARTVRGWFADIQKRGLREPLKPFLLPSLSKTQKFPPEIYEMYDLWSDTRSQNYMSLYLFKNFIDEQNEIRNTCYDLNTVKAWFAEIENSGEKPPLKPCLSSDITPEVLQMFDEWDEIRSRTITGEYPFEKFTKEQNEKHGTKYTRASLSRLFKKIVNFNLRLPLSPYLNSDITSEQLDMYDGWSEIRGRTYTTEYPLRRYIEDQNRLRAANYDLATIKIIFNKIAECGLRPPLKDFHEDISYTKVVEECMEKHEEFSFNNMYDEWHGIYTGTYKDSYLFDEFIKKQNERYDMNLNRKELIREIKKIENDGLRQPLQLYLYLTITPEQYEMYDEWSDIRSNTYKGEYLFDDFLKKHSEMKNKEFVKMTMLRTFRTIEEKGLRPPLKPYKTKEKQRK